MALENFDTLSNDINSIMNNIDILQDKQKELKSSPKPYSDTRIFLHMSGLDNTKAIQLLYDLKLDHAIDNLVNKFMTGDFSSIEKYADIIGKIFEAIGLGKNSFQGPVSQLFINNVMNTFQSLNFQKTKSNISKMLQLLNVMGKQAKAIKDKEVKKKYKEAVKAFKRIVLIIKRVMKDRRIIATGLHNIVNESCGDAYLHISFGERLE